MQTVRSSVARSASRAARPSRSAVVVRASAESRRGFLSAVVAGAALVAVEKAQALTPVDLLDDRKARANGFDIIYEARDLSLPQAQRDGLVQARSSLDSAKTRARESEKRIDTELEPLISKKYWTLAKELLRGQVGTLRFDLNTLASAKASKEDKKKALGLRKDFIASVEALDFAIRSKDEAASAEKLVAAKAALDTVLAFVA